MEKCPVRKGTGHTRGKREQDLGDTGDNGNEESNSSPDCKHHVDRLCDP